MVRLILLTVGAAIGVSAFFASIVYLSAFVSAQAHAWVLENLPLLFAAAGMSVIVGAAAIQTRNMTRYRHGENPLSVAHVFIAFGRPKAAIRYLEEALRHHPTSEPIQRKLRELRSKR